MATIGRQIDVDAAPPVVAATWDRFIHWAHNGAGRLACDDLACVDAVRAGLVTFVPSSAGGTLVTFRLETQEAGPSGDVIARHLGHDLVVFKDYVERVGARGGRPTPPEKKAVADADDRRRHRADGERMSKRDGTVSYTDHFPT